MESRVLESPQERDWFAALRRIRQKLGVWSIFGDRTVGSVSEIFVCQLSDGLVCGVHLRRLGSGIEANSVTFTTDEDSSSFLGKLGTKCPVVALLPKSKYLIKVLEVPKVLPEEVNAMLKLEAEALLPPEFGTVEISYRQLQPSKEGYQKCEVYISRHAELNEYLSFLAKFGVRPDWVLPGAIAWVGAFDVSDRPDLFAAAINSNVMEVAALYEDRAVAVRTIDVATGLDRGLVDFIRPFLVHSSAQTAPLVIGWIGNHCPNHLESNRVIFKNLNSLIPAVEVAQAEGAQNNGLLRLSAVVLLWWFVLESGMAGN